RRKIRRRNAMLAPSIMLFSINRKSVSTKSNFQATPARCLFKPATVFFMICLPGYLKWPTRTKNKRMMAEKLSRQPAPKNNFLKKTELKRSSHVLYIDNILKGGNNE